MTTTLFTCFLVLLTLVHDGPGAPLDLVAPFDDLGAVNEEPEASNSLHGIRPPRCCCQFVRPAEGNATSAPNAPLVVPGLLAVHDVALLTKSVAHSAQANLPAQARWKIIPYVPRLDRRSERLPHLEERLQDLLVLLGGRLAPTLCATAGSPLLVEAPHCPEDLLLVQGGPCLDRRPA